MKKMILFLSLITVFITPFWGGQTFLMGAFAQNYIDTKPGNQSGSLKVENNYFGYYSSFDNEVTNVDNKLNISYIYVDPNSPSYRNVAGIKNNITNRSRDATRGIRTEVKNTFTGPEGGPYSFDFTTSGGSFFSSADVGNVYGLFGSANSLTSDSQYTGTYYGVRGSAYSYNTTGYTYGIYGSASANVTNNRIFAGYFNGNVHVNGTLSKSAGTFKIDHPLDPENKYLSHSFVESPDMMNVYNGNTITDDAGYATVTLPAYFEALNIDFRYQLTPLGKLAQVAVIEKIKGSQFKILSDKPNTEVSWQVTGIRNDAYAQKNRVKVEEDKIGNEKGKYLNAEAFGKPKAMNIHVHGETEEKK